MGISARRFRQGAAGIAATLSVFSTVVMGADALSDAKSFTDNVPGGIVRKSKIMQGAWRKGGLHAHTLWSDGRSLPEKAIDTVKKAGFDFWCITEHNFFPDQRNAWREVCSNEGTWPPQLSQSEFDSAQGIVPGYPETMQSGTWRVLARLMTFQEMSEAFNEPDKFLLIPGSEFTPGRFVDATGRKHIVHANWLNIPAPANIPAESTVTATLDKFYETYLKMDAKSDRETCFLLNHPFWPYFDILSTDMVTRPGIILAEICNGGPDIPPPDTMPGIEKWWDGVNTFRLIDGKPCVYGVGSDDAHYYDADRAVHSVGGVGAAFVVVHLPGAMTADRIMRALKNGDFYASTGAYFDSVEMDYERGILKVKVRKIAGAKQCHIRFNGTKRGFDRSIEQRFIPYDGKPEFDREVPVYSEDVGKVLAETDGWSAEYKLSPDDLYVRATAVLDVESGRTDQPDDRYYPHHLTAWTQPMVGRQ